jgi:hypothetical protein
MRAGRLIGVMNWRGETDKQGYPDGAVLHVLGIRLIASCVRQRAPPAVGCQ